MTAIVKDISVHPDFRYHNRRVNFETPAQKLLAATAARRALNPSVTSTFIQFVDYPSDKGGVTESGLTREQAFGLGFDLSNLSPEALSSLLRDEE